MYVQKKPIYITLTLSRKLSCLSVNETIISHPFLKLPLTQVKCKSVESTRQEHQQTEIVIVCGAYLEQFLFCPTPFPFCLLLLLLQSSLYYSLWN